MELPSEARSRGEGAGRLGLGRAGRRNLRRTCGRERAAFPRSAAGGEGGRVLERSWPGWGVWGEPNTERSTLNRGMSIVRIVTLDGFSNLSETVE